jgi:arylsulfatase A-like enzyme
MRRRRIRRLAAALAAALAASACSIHQRARTAASLVDSPVGRSVCILFFDGLSRSEFDHLLNEGALPNLKREIVDRGLSFDTAVASIPSETYPNLGAMLTGLYPGHHGIPANIWLDRRLRLSETHTNIFRIHSAADFLAPDAKTLYERLPADSVVVTSPMGKGAAVWAKNTFSIVASYLTWNWESLDRKTLDDAGDAYAGALQAGRLPSIVFAHLLGPDEVAHADGPESPAFRSVMVNIDHSFGRLVRRLRRERVLDRILFVLVADHGNETYGTTADAAELVHRALISHPTEADCAGANCVLVPADGKRRKSYDVGDAQIAVGAYRGVMIWLPASRLPENVPGAFSAKPRKKPKRRRGAPLPPKITMPAASAFAAALARAPEVALVVTRGTEGGHVLVYGPKGRSEIVREEGEGEPPLYSYRVLAGEDPLGYAARPALAAFVTGEPFDADEWLAATSATAYPDLVVQLPEFFDSPRAPDVYLSPREGVGFRSGKAAGHGGLLRLEMVVPLVFAGPGVEPGHRPAARTVDLAPTILGWLGVPFNADEMDGVDLRIAAEPLPLAPPLPLPSPGAPDDAK